MHLRDYQNRVIDKIRNAYKQGYKAPILRLDCGAGKTLTTLAMAYECAKRGHEVLFLVHRKELLNQTINALQEFPKCTLIRVGMILTVAHHLDNYNPYLIICDECNFALARSWRRVLDYYPNAYKLGLSATPCRLDGTPMGDIFDCIIEDVDAELLIEHHYLSQYKYYAPQVNLPDALYKIKGSDFDMEEFAKNAIYSDVLKYCDNNYKTIIYSPTIAYSVRLCSILNEHGFVAKHFDANTPAKEREQIINDFRNGKIRFLLNVDLISFGFDCPSADRCFLLRPTMSLALYIQQAMRCLRYQEGKTAEIYDFVGNVYRHGLPTEKREWSLNKKTKCRNPSGEKDITARMCSNCFRVYKGNSRICPYCGHEQPLNKREIQEKQDAELLEIKKLERKEQGRAQSLQDLIKLAKARGYNIGWAFRIYNSRNKKI